MRLLMLTFAVLAACGATVRVAAQDRMPPIPADKMTDAQRTAVAEFKTARSADVSGPLVGDRISFMTS